MTKPTATHTIAEHFVGREPAVEAAYALAK